MILVAAAAAITLTVLTAGFNLLLRSNLDADANRVLQARASAALETITVRGGSLRISESSDRGAPDSQVWIYDGSRAIERPPAAPSVQRLADSLARGSSTGAEDPAADTRLRADPVGAAAAPAGTVVSAISLEPYEHSASRALM